MTEAFFFVGFGIAYLALGATGEWFWGRRCPCCSGHTRTLELLMAAVLGPLAWVIGPLVHSR